MKPNAPQPLDAAEAPEIVPPQTSAEVAPSKDDTVQAEEARAHEADVRKAQEIREGLQPAQEEVKEAEYPQDNGTKAAKDKYRQEYLESHQDSLTDLLGELIKSYPRRGKPVEQAQRAVAFEATLDYCIEKGKSTPAEVMRSIILGVANGIVRHEHIDYYQRYINNLPALEFLFGKEKRYFEKMAKKFKGSLGAEYFKHFYWTVIIVDPKVKDRIQKSAPANQWDHNATAWIAPGGDQNVGKALATKSQNQTSVENAYAGSLAWLKENLKMSVKKSPAKIRGQLGFFLALHGASTANRAYQNVQPIKGERFVLNDQTRQTVPRGSMELFGKEKTIGAIDKDIWSLIKPFEPALFALLEKPNLTLAELQAYMQKKYNMQISSFDDFYDKIEEILKKIVPDKKVRRGFFLMRWFFG